MGIAIGGGFQPAATPRLDFQALSARIAISAAGRRTTKAIEQMRRLRVLEDRSDALATDLADQACRKLHGVGMGKVNKFELGKGVPTFELGTDLQKYLEDTMFLKVRIPEGGAEVHHWIYEKAKRRQGLHPPVDLHL